jgi:hypothetical protein
MNKIPDSNTERQRIMRGRNIVVALLLAGFAVLTFAISIAKMG